MIFQPFIAGDAGHEALREYLESDIRLALDEPADAPGDVGEIAATLATAWAVDFRRATLPSLVYPLLASRLLCRLGRRGHAERLLRSRVRSGHRTDQLLRVMQDGGPSLRACTLLADGVLRPAASSLCLTGGTWVVDVGRLAGGAGPVLELRILGHLRRALEAAADLIDGDAGSGQVVLSGVDGPAAGAGRPGLPSGAELCRFARDVLERAAHRRGWQEIPGVHLQARGRSSN